MTSSTEGCDPHDRARQARLRTSCFDEFFRYYYPRLCRSLKSQTSDTGLAEAVVNEAMTVAYDKWEYLLTMERPDAYVLKIAIRMLRRQVSQRREIFGIDEDIASTEGDLMMAAAFDDWVNDYMDVIRVLRSLPSRQAEVAVLHCLSGYTMAEIADILDIAEPTVKEHFARAKTALRVIYGPAREPDRKRRVTP
jgi:RNA polymerase sigma-70 factor (ECF subfamily)